MHLSYRWQATLVIALGMLMAILALASGVLILVGR